MNATELLELRRPVPSTREFDTSDEALAEEITSVLGYGGYERHIRGESLGAVLRKLDIAVIPTDAVEQYKKEQMRAFSRAMDALPHAGELREALRRSPSQEEAMYYSSYIEEELRRQGIGVPFFSRDQRQAEFASFGSLEAAWSTIRLDEYEGTVPRRALADAVRIKKHLPDAEFHVQELQTHVKYDPFLLVSCGDQRYFIYVWDEPNFDA